jgi:hypothetical protein
MIIAAAPEVKITPEIWPTVGEVIVQIDKRIILVKPLGLANIVSARGEKSKTGIKQPGWD